jgi:hypothetical protein
MSLGIGVILGTVGVTRLYPFLALHAPVDAETLVVEGWISDVALQAVANECRTRSNTVLYVTGGPLAKGSYLVEFETFADLGAATLRALGLDPQQLIAVPAPQTHGNRTLHAAMALHRHFLEHQPAPAAINVITEGAHARRSRLLFQRALGGATRVGVICIPDPNYDSSRWWAYSEGWRAVIAEAVGFAYAVGRSEWEDGVSVFR